MIGKLRREQCAAEKQMGDLKDAALLALSSSRRASDGIAGDGLVNRERLDQSRQAGDCLCMEEYLCEQGKICC
jgi:hypothetical protein